MTARLDETVLAELDGMLAGADADAARMYPGDRDVRQPVHTVYVPAHTYAADTVRNWGAAALAALADHAPGTDEFARLLDVPPAVLAASVPLVRDKLAREPIEDLRVDFEDGLGPCSGDEEDALAAAAGAAVRRAVEQGTCPPSIGLRVKSFEAATRARGIRTFDVFLGGLLAGGPLPDGFVVTLPKVTAVAQVEAMDRLCERLEDAYALPRGRLRFEVQVETPQVILAADGTATVARIVHAASGRLSGLHYGTYDYSAACGIAAGYQSLEHPVADHARAVMQLAAAGTGVSISDGSTNVVPVGDSAAVRSAWALHARLVRRSLERGFYQGWDLHPAQLPTRYLATYAFFRAGMADASARLRDYGGEGGVRGVQDEPATVHALAGFVRRGLDCGAFTEDELEAGSLREVVR